MRVEQGKLEIFASKVGKKEHRSALNFEGSAKSKLTKMSLIYAMLQCVYPK